MKRPTLSPRAIGTLSCILGLLIAGLAASPSASAAAIATMPPDDDIVCIGAGSGDIQCDVRVFPCARIACVWVCGLGQEDYRPCSLLPIPGATEASASMVVASSSGDLLCVGWGGGDIHCIVRVYECYGVDPGYCFWTCPTHEPDHGCDLLP